MNELQDELEEALLPLRQDRDRIEFLSAFLRSAQYLPDGHISLCCGGSTFVGTSLRDATDKARQRLAYLSHT